MRRQRRREPYTIQIDTLSHEGRGVGRLNGKTTFVRGALPGETVQARTTRSRGSFNEALCLEVIEASPKRITPACLHADVCGGCSLLHLSAEHQIEHKQSVLFELLEHHAGLSELEHLPPLRGPEWGYRQKARLGVKFVEKKGGALVGFREKAAPYIADIERCIVLNASVGERLTELRVLINKLSIRARVPQIEVAVGDESVALVLRHLELFNAEDLSELAAFQLSSGLNLYLQPGGEDSVHPLNEQTKRLHYVVDGVRIDFEPTDFTQVNGVMNRKMIDLVCTQLALDPADRVLDLFCGLGNFSLPIARRSAAVHGIEGSTALVARAAANATSNQIDNATFASANLAELSDVERIEMDGINKVLLDPPRTGADILVKHLPLKKVQRLVYVSCNPVTLARDTRDLVSQHGFHLDRAGVMDMFPHTSHVESIAVFSRG